MGAFSVVEGDVTIRSSGGVELSTEDGAALVSNARGFIAVLYDGTSTRFARCDSSGRQQVVGAAAHGASVTGINPVLAGVSDGTNLYRLFSDTSGRLRIVGAGAAGSGVVGDPVRVAGSDGTNTRDLLTDPGGRLQVDVARWFGATTPTVGQKAMTASLPVVVASDQTALAVGGKDAHGAAPTANPVLVAGWDNTNVRRLLTDTQGRLVTAPPGQSSTTRGFALGRVVLATTAISPIRETTYTEQSSNAQRSIASASANDAAAGTGARTVELTYYAFSGGTITGPFTETLTLNGTTAVNTVATNICFIEKLVVKTAGSGGVNAGIVTLYASTGGGGGAVWSIAARANQTFGAHHYVSNGKTCFITGMMGGIKGADTTAVFLRSKDPSVADSAEIQITDFLRAPSSGQNVRNYGTPVRVVGPARIVGYASPDSTSSRTYYCSFDFYEE